MPHRGVPSGWPIYPVWTSPGPSAKHCGATQPGHPLRRDRRQALRAGPSWAEDGQGWYRYVKGSTTCTQIQPLTNSSTHSPGAKASNDANSSFAPSDTRDAQRTSHAHGILRDLATKSLNASPRHRAVQGFVFGVRAHRRCSWQVIRSRQPREPSTGPVRTSRGRRSAADFGKPPPFQRCWQYALDLG